MRLYRKQFARQFVDQRVSNKTETRDAILWDVDEGNFRCRVKIQGSDEYIIAHYPRNWKKKPYWLKPGNAVRILHRSGIRGYVEVIGEGRAAPMPTEGSGVIPEEPELEDMIITPLEVKATTPESMAVIITNGTYRIDNVVYTYDPEPGSDDGVIIMNDPAPMIMGSGIKMKMGLVWYTKDVDAAPAAGYSRYDAFVIGADGEVDYVKGTAAKTNPVKPSIPDEHLLISDYILVKGDVTEIVSTDIGAQWAAAIPSSLSMTYSSTFAWSGGGDTPEMDVTATVKDQYGATLTGTWTIQLTRLAGIGQVWSSDTGYDGDEVQNTCTSSYTFKYQRNQAGTEVSPVVLEAVLLNNTDAKGWAYITLLDSEGDPI